MGALAMMRELIDALADWGPLDTWIVVTAALASMSCAVPGVFLFVRRQSMMGDALSHTALPGIAIAFLVAMWLRDGDWITQDAYVAWRHGAAVVGAALIGVCSAVLVETVQKIGRVEANAALGVVFTSLFAVGLLLVRLFADKVDLDPDCVLYGTIETAVMDRTGWLGLPPAVIVNGGALLGNLLLVALFFKELRIAAFDPALATSMGIHAQLIHYLLTSVTAVTLVAAFESVGSILVVAMLVAPAATAHLIVDRLGKLVLLALVVAAFSAGLGHVLAMTVPTILFRILGYEESITASTAGMMAVAAGLVFAAAALFGPRYGAVSRVWHRLRLSVQEAAEDLLGALYRREEQGAAPSAMVPAGRRSLRERIALRWLLWTRELAASPSGITLTEAGRRRAERLVRSHRLWESYLARHLPLPEDHFLSGSMRAEIDAELAAPGQDPHGRAIPAEEVPPATTGSHG
jgi:manganese/zinc/iron transport system permease protein